jgi:hypothetical protein
MESLLSTLLILVEVDYIIVVRHHTMSTTILIQPSAARHCYTNEFRPLVDKHVQTTLRFKRRIATVCKQR